jgi:DNA-binding NarL/FixJ family response regulator
VASRSQLEKIRTLTARVAGLDAQRERAVATAMAAGATWAEIGEALGVSAQGGAQAVSLAASQPGDGRVLV